VVVDNYSLRGSSGVNLEALDSTLCVQLRDIRAYDLIVLQYGLNVANVESLHYGWYRKRMVEVINRLHRLFPDANVLLLGVSDRSYQEAGTYATMPAVLALMHEQRKAAKQTKITFWNIFQAMGGENSMVKYVKNNWASKDYTHLSFRGGREVSKLLLNAILLEKQFYDKVEERVQ
jgi:lysophospholipase L1-like esterase